MSIHEKIVLEFTFFGNVLGTPILNKFMIKKLGLFICIINKHKNAYIALLKISLRFYLLNLAILKKYPRINKEIEDPKQNFVT